MELDHFVIHMGDTPEEAAFLAERCASAGLPFYLSGSRTYAAFAAHYIYIGLEYLELVQLMDPDHSGWVPAWVDRYKRGVRGVYALFLATEDIESVARALSVRGWDVTVERTAYTDENGATRECPWQIIFTPPIPGTDFEINFIQYDSPRAELRRFFEPNADSRGLTGIEVAHITMPLGSEARNHICTLFPETEESPESLRIVLGRGELLCTHGPDVKLDLGIRSAEDSGAVNTDPFEVYNVRMSVLS